MDYDEVLENHEQQIVEDYNKEFGKEFTYLEELPDQYIFDWVCSHQADQADLAYEMARDRYLEDQVEEFCERQVEHQ